MIMHEVGTLNENNLFEMHGINNFKISKDCSSELLVGHLGGRSTYMIYMIYLLTAIGLSPGCRSTVHIYSQTIHRTIRNKQYIEQHNNF